MASGLRYPLMPQDPNIPVEEASLPQKSEIKLSATVPEKEIMYPKADNFDVPYFRKCLLDERKKLTLLCEKWTKIQSELSDVDNLDVITGDIRSVIGQARLVIAERFAQFHGLVDNCEFGTSEKAVTCEDLQGFWEMIYFQVQDVIDKFTALGKRKANQWKVDSEKISKPKKLLKKSKTRSSGEIAAAAARREAAKKRLAAAKAALKKEHLQPAITFDAGFFKIDSPARQVMLKMKTPCSKTPKKTVTPKSANFLHGRYLKTKSGGGSNTKKTLNFGTPEVQISNENEPSEKVIPKKLQMQEERIDKSNSADETAGNKENVGPQTDPKFSDQKLFQHQSLKTKTVATLTEPYNVMQFGSAIATIFDQIKVISSVQEDIKSHSVTELEKKLSAFEEENAALKSANARLQENSDVRELSSNEYEDSYEAHYKRVLKQNVMLKSELSVYSEVGIALKTSEVKWKETFDLFFKKSKELEELRDFLNEKSERLNEREKSENEELIRLRDENSKQKEEIEKLVEAMNGCKLLSSELSATKQAYDQLIAENKDLRENCEIIRNEKHQLTQKFAAQCEEMESLQKKLQLLKDEQTFEQVEFATEKDFFEEEKNLLQSHLAKTEKALHNTTEIVQKFKDEAIENQNEIENLKKELESAREDIIVLREETDITKINSRLAIMEQQEEVINCETKLRQLIEIMTDFLLKLKKTNSENVNCEDVPLLSDHPLKTPSKSIVVSALLRHDNQGMSQEWSPEEKFDTKVKACLFALVNDVTSLMSNITKAAREVAARYEQEKMQLITDKSTLKTKIESLKHEMASQSETDKEMEITLRKRLFEIQEEKNELLQRLNYRK